jgi:hypothetical protein
MPPTKPASGPKARRIYSASYLAALKTFPHSATEKKKNVAEHLCSRIEAVQHGSAIQRTAAAGCHPVRLLNGHPANLPAE